MSVRFDTSTDNLRVVGIGTPLTIGSSGAVVLAHWVKLMGDSNARADIALISSAVGTDPSIGSRLGSTGTVARMSFQNGGEFGTYDLSLDTWYYVVCARYTDTHAHLRIFDDSTSTTPLSDIDQDVDTQNYASFDSILLGDGGFGLAAGNVEIACLKIHTGVDWSNAECRTESQNLDLVKAGGTDRLVWELEDIDADSHGINESGGSGFNLTNSGAVAGASRPSQLEAQGGSATTLYFLDSAASGSNFGQLQVGGSAPSTATTATGWTVDTVASGNYALMAYASERASTNFSGTAQPAGNPDNSLGDCFRSTSTMSGDFATGVWTIAVPVIAVSAAAGQDGRVRVRLWKSSNATGTSPTEITSGAVAGTTVTNLTTGAEQVSTVTTGSITGFSMTNEYLFVQIAWEITGAAT